MGQEQGRWKDEAGNIAATARSLEPKYGVLYRRPSPRNRPNQKILPNRAQPANFPQVLGRRARDFHVSFTQLV